MGKRNKGHRKGPQRTASKTEKKEARKREKDEAKYEEDIEAALSAGAAAVTEEVPRPSPRAHCSLVAHPSDDRTVVMFGGEFVSGGSSHAFCRDLLRARVAKDGSSVGPWRRTVSPASPLPRCSHQCVAARHGGADRMWLFGGEFCTPDGDKFRHFGDLWACDLATGAWELVCAQQDKPRPLSSKAQSLPCPRSGHRMAFWKKHLVLFGGYHETMTGARYFNDLWVFDVDARRWIPCHAPEGLPAPEPRSGCQVAVHGDTLFVFGGFCRRSKQAVAASRARKGKGKHAPDDDAEESGVFLNDVWSVNLAQLGIDSERADPESAAPSSSSATTGAAASSSPSGAAAAAATAPAQLVGVANWQRVKAGGKAPIPRTGMTSVMFKKRVYFFGGVADSEDGEDSAFFNELITFNVEKLKWFPSKLKDVQKVPSPRYGCQSTLCGSQMVIWGGLTETEKSEFTFDDLWVCDLNKLEGFSMLLEPTRTAEVEPESDEEEEGGEEEEGEEEEEGAEEEEEEEEEGGGGEKEPPENPGEAPQATEPTPGAPQSQPFVSTL